MKRRKLSKAEKVQVQRIMGGFRYLVEIGVLVPKLEVKREVNYARWMEETYSFISDAGPQGISISALRGLVSCGNSTLDECLDRLKAAGRIVRNPDKRWVVVEHPLTVVA
jgi:hypothetical protein